MDPFDRREFLEASLAVCKDELLQAISENDYVLALELARKAGVLYRWEREVTKAIDEDRQ